MIPYKIQQQQDLEPEYQAISVFLIILIQLMILKKAYGEYNQYRANSKIQLNHYDSVWNIIDTQVIIFVLLSSSLDLLQTIYKDNEYVSYIQTLESFSILTLGIRFLAVCRGFRSMSFMIRLLDDIIQDIQGFVSVFLFLILTFSFSGKPPLII